ncbi:MAG: hypothetical protein ACRCXZ_09845 [Patescibacteria group bacterium]
MKLFISRLTTSVLLTFAIFLLANRNFTFGFCSSFFDSSNISNIYFSANSEIELIQKPISGDDKLFVDEFGRIYNQKHDLNTIFKLCQFSIDHPKQFQRLKRLANMPTSN